MKKSLLIYFTIFLPLFVFSQDYQLCIIDSFDLKLPGLAYIAYENDELCVNDSSLNRIYLMDTTGFYTDSITLTFKINGIDLYLDTLFILKTGIFDKGSTILKMDKHRGEIYDSLVWKMGTDTIYSEFLTVTGTSFVSYISAGWSSSLVQIDQAGTIVNSIFSPGLGDPEGISSSIPDKFCYISSTGKNENGYYFEYEIKENGITNSSSLDVPVYSPKGIACINENSFYTYSGANRKMYKIYKKATNPDKIGQYYTPDVVSIFPNPSRGIVNINSEIPIEKIDIITSNGQLIQHFKSDGRFLDLTSLKKGCYILVLHSSKIDIRKKLTIY